MLRPSIITWLSTWVVSFQIRSWTTSLFRHYITLLKILVTPLWQIKSPARLSRTFFYGSICVSGSCPHRHEAKAVVLRERSPIGLNDTISGRFNVLCSFSPMLQRRDMGRGVSPPRNPYRAFSIMPSQIERHLIFCVVENYTIQKDVWISWESKNMVFQTHCHYTKWAGKTP